MEPVPGECLCTRHGRIDVSIVDVTGRHTQVSSPSRPDLCASMFAFDKYLNLGEDFKKQLQYPFSSSQVFVFGLKHLALVFFLLPDLGQSFRSHVRPSCQRT